MSGATKSRATSSRASARGSASLSAVSPSSKEMGSSGPGQEVLTSKNWTPSPSAPAGVSSKASRSGAASLCTELSLSSSMSRVLFRLVPGLKLLLSPVPGRKLVDERLEAVLNRPVDPIAKLKPPVEPKLDNLPLIFSWAPVPGRDPVPVPKRVEAVVGLVELVPGRFCIFACAAKACNCETARSAMIEAAPPFEARLLMTFAASFLTSPLRCSAALTA
mmetsp:Transcript_80495/g.260705  ORF Transcript_80495/g.260705 Transcript_80495/m.260705 type:complete len:219 (-) Transcript_80495:3621-4277(-)